MKIFELRNSVKLYFGPDSIEKLGESVVNLGKKAFVVTGMNSARKTGLLQKVINKLENVGIEYVLFEKITPNPLSTAIYKGAKQAREQECDFVIGIGGGSAIDAAKAIALCAVNEGNIVDYQPGGKYSKVVPQKALPIVAITTTAGTGTEINRYLVVTNVVTNEKPGIGFECTYPTVAIVDPNLMTSITCDVTADTGVDVFFHAMEAYISLGANRFSDMISEEAIKLVVKNLGIVIKDGNNIEARTDMAWASTLAGLAIDYAGTVAIHGAGHPISGHFNATHGKTLAALSVAFLKNNYNSNPKKFAQLAVLLGYEKGNLTEEELASKSPEAMRNFLKSVDRDISIKSLGVSKEDIPKLVADSFKTMEGAMLNNPKELSKEDVYKLYTDSL